MAESIITVVLEVAKCLAPHQISYLRSYNNNFENLKRKIEEIKDHKASVQYNVDNAEGNGEVIEERVEEWLESISKAIVEAEELVGYYHEVAPNRRCFKGLCPNRKARFQLSKYAVRQLEALDNLHEKGRFDRIYYPSVLEDVRLLSSKGYEAFESRRSTMNDVLGALKDPDVNMLGIYGMAGVGKTTLAIEVARQIKSEFDQVVFVEVSQSPNIIKIQGEIADRLGMSFHEMSESGRASSLYNRLKKESRILIILDNIWENLDLQAVGIPHGDDHKGCKVLLTARSVDVLSMKMDSQQNFLIGVLKEEEAWNLFKMMAGDYIEGNEFKSVATEMVKACAGLPISIINVGRVLRNKTLVEWNDALEQLRSPWLKSFPDMQPAAYSAITLSYNKLEVEELKKIFLLIAHANLESVDELLMYGMGLGLFEGIYHMEKARVRVCTLIYKLKASCMLLDHVSNDEEWFSMHQVVRDVAISIASREQNMITVTNGELVNQWESSDESTIKFYTSIVLFDVKTIDVHPEDLDCSELKLFRMVATEKSLSLTISDDFFETMIQVRVLDLTYMNLLSLPSSLGLLINLRTLCLCYCKLQDIDVVGNFKKLKILCLKGSHIKQLSEEVGRLSQLKLLDLRNCWQLEVIPPNVLSKLSLLEELYIYCFNKWGVMVEGLNNASLDELNCLPKLTSLELQIKEVKTLPRDLFFEKLERFNICIGHVDNGLSDMTMRTKISRVFKLELNTNICFKDVLIVQLKGVEGLRLSGLEELDVKYLVDEFVKVGSLQLKCLYVRGCDAPKLKIMEESTSDIRVNEITDGSSFFSEKVAIPNLESLSLHSINVERIWQSELAAMSCGFQNITDLCISNCWNLKCLFSSSILVGSLRLQYLYLEHCPILEEIIIVDQIEAENVIFRSLETEIVAEDEGDNAARDEIIFRNLKELHLSNLNSLTSFYSGNFSLKFPYLETLIVEGCSNMKIFSRGELSTPKLPKVQLDKILDLKGRPQFNNTITTS